MFFSDLEGSEEVTTVTPSCKLKKDQKPEPVHGCTAPPVALWVGSDTRHLLSNSGYKRHVHHRAVGPIGSATRCTLLHCAVGAPPSPAALRT